MPFERVVLPVFISSVIPRTLVAHQFIAHTCLPKVSPPSTLLSELRPSPMSNRRKQPWMPHGVPMNARAAFKPASTPQRQPKFYAIQRGRNGYNGIVNTWEECKPFVSGVSGAIFKSFRTQAEARAFVQRGVNAARPVTHTAPRPPLPIAQTRPLPQAGASAGTTQQAPSTDPSESLNELYRYTKADELAAAAADPSDEAPEKLVVFTDGACTGNGTHKAKAGYGIYFGRESPYNVAEALPGQASNQRAEMTAVLEAMRITLDHGLVAKKGRLLVYTDSKYTMDGMNMWVNTWKKNGWTTSSKQAVKNKEIWLALDACRQALALKTIEVVLQWVKGHSGIEGNEAADRLAVRGMRGN